MMRAIKTAIIGAGLSVLFSAVSAADDLTGEPDPSKLGAQVRSEIEFQAQTMKMQLYFNSGLSMPPLQPGLKVINGEDDRKDVCKLNDTNELEAKIKSWTASTCILTSRDRVLQTDTGDYELLLSSWQWGGYRPCSNERFATQLTGGWCSGFLVGEDLIATAGHCCGLGDEEAARIAFIFGFGLQCEDGSASPLRLGQDAVYFGSKLVAHEYSSHGDFAIVRLDRKVTYPHAMPLPVRSEGSPLPNDPIGMIGYPSGLPAKAAFGDSRVFEALDVWLRTNLDAYCGNSGSVVMNHDGLVEGILVRGEFGFQGVERRLRRTLLPIYTACRLRCRGIRDQGFRFCRCHRCRCQQLIRRNKRGHTRSSP